ncbi:MAG TPA: type I restriction endonuclease subunit M, partial [Gallionellaceae bacterium]|nr:type I restriction endonuclease subunit M [Gallionellaceae bacterium]
MAIKKSELYSSLWASCDELRGGMDASQYKDYVLVMLFVKYVSDKYAGQPYAPITIPKGASFKDMVALKGKSDIGDQINKKIIGPLAAANKLSDMPDFNDPSKLGSGQELVEKLTNLIGIFENKALDFSKNRAEGDDILGDAYEYLMRHFATESGKSKGQFYTPAEVSRVMAQIIGIREARTTNDTTVYDPTCGSGSLLLKVAAEASAKVTLYGQEKDTATAGLAQMNMILHDNPLALIKGGYSTLANPLFMGEDGKLKTFDYVVANPPFSDKRWSTGLNPLNDAHERFQHYGTPPAKQGDYAYLLHIVRSLKNSGKGACILPHGVLFRGNAEADIRRNLIRKGYIKGIIGLPANLFYGTGIPACIVVIDKAHSIEHGAHTRKGIFMLDASKGFIKDGNKNRLRDCDVHKIVDVFSRRDDSDPKYARMVGLAEIEKNEYNLNIPRYIDGSEQEDKQDIAGHLQGGIPEADVEALHAYWDVCPNLKRTLFSPLPLGGRGAGERAGYLHLTVDKQAIKSTIYEHPEFASFVERMNAHFEKWREQASVALRTEIQEFHPKELIYRMSEGLLNWYADKPLLDKYDVYQHLMDYWAEIMQDDCYLIA